MLRDVQARVQSTEWKEQAEPWKDLMVNTMHLRQDPCQTISDTGRTFDRKEDYPIARGHPLYLP